MTSSLGTTAQRHASTKTGILQVLYRAAWLQPDSAGLYTYASELLRALGMFTTIQRCLSKQQAFLADGPHQMTSVLSEHSISVVDVRGMPLLQTMPGAWRQSGSLRSITEKLDRRALRPFFRYVDKQQAWHQIAAKWPMAPMVDRWLLGSQVGRFDCIHWLHPGEYLPLWSAPSVVTVHDVISLRHPEWFPAGYSAAERIVFDMISHYTARIMADSEHTKRDIISLFGVPEERIDVVYPGVTRSIETGPMDPENMQETLARYGVQENNYIICVSTIEPRKNMVRLAQAFKEVLRRHPDLTMKLLLVGKRGWGLEDIERGLAETGLGERLVMTGRVSQEDLVMLYQGAMAVAYMSLYEGFGLPALEALASGKPLVASNTTSLPEVVGDAGLLVDPLDVREIADSLEVIVLDEDLRADLSRRGKTQAALFTYEKTAAGAIQTYRRAKKSWNQVDER